jgi:hypothetical protein
MTFDAKKNTMYSTRDVVASRRKGVKGKGCPKKTAFSGRKLLRGQKMYKKQQSRRFINYLLHTNNHHITTQQWVNENRERR